MGGADLSIDGTKYAGSTTDSPSLIINNLVMQDAGQYQCIAANPGGTYPSHRSATLTVINRQFQDYCNASLPCDDSKELECSQSTWRCVCKRTFYHNNKQCFTRDRLKVTITSHSSSTSTFFVSWIPPSYDVNLVSGYIVIWRIHDQAESTQQSQTVDKSVTSHTVSTGLIPGQLYIVTVTSSVTLSNPASNIQLHSDLAFIRIVPLPPGSILDSSDFSPDDLMLNWTPPINSTEVTKYDVTINGTTLSTLDSTTKIQFTKQLIPATHYRVGIVTVSGQDIHNNEEKRSVAYTEEIWTIPRMIIYEEESTSSIVYSIPGILLIIIVFTIAICIWWINWRKPKEDSERYTDLTLHDGRSSDHTYSTLDQRTRTQREKPIPILSFGDHVPELMKDSRLKICNEFSELLRSKETAITTEAISKINTNKNRGRVVPYDFNRVQLQEKRDGSDYINASFVLNQSYIMAQCPLPKTAGHFWHMVWEQNCPSIIALTGDDEKYKEKWYFPTTDGAVHTVGGIDVELVATFTVLEKVVLRKIKLSKGKQLKNVNHFHAYGLQMVNMSEELLNRINLVASNNSKLQSNGPYVVHSGCVGIDYSGIFVLVDYLVKLIESGVNSIDVYGSTFTIMSERMDAVTTEEQYAVIYTCLKSYLNNHARSGKHHATFERRDAESAYEYLP
ncbi:receptor-type tyrosine-protein phosphatase O-like [Ostrea edulis]|uniref:receptor-type tyrosine-protein phosphatase O-like n=1 Tax=Ostrea edulis TaxID=37623 RepID=UPI0024AEFB3D|nr:receptor-type tyrosine-protein phosphatase O-like [Ostrea edulis]